jgi:hypothetical protein
MAIDTVNHHLFVGGGETLVMMDTQTGTVLASAPICVGTDATTLDSTTSAVFVSCSDGHIKHYRIPSGCWCSDLNNLLEHQIQTIKTGNKKRGYAAAYPLFIIDYRSF